MQNQSNVFDMTCRGIPVKLPGDTNLVINVTFNIILSSLVIFINPCIITVIWRKKELQTPSNVLLLNNAIADTILGISVLFSWTPFLILAMTFKELCLFFEVTFAALNLSAQVSLSNLTLIALDRYLAIYKPFVYIERIKHNLHMYIKCITLLWIMTILMVGCCYLTPQYMLSAAWGVLNIGIAYVSSSYVYINIYLTVKKINRTTLQNDVYENKKKEIRLAKITVLMLITTSVSFVPSAYNTILWIIDHESVTRESYTLFIWSITVFLLKCLMHCLLFSLALSSIRVRIYTMFGRNSIQPENSHIEKETHRSVDVTNL